MEVMSVLETVEYLHKTSEVYFTMYWDWYLLIGFIYAFFMVKRGVKDVFTYGGGSNSDAVRFMYKHLWYFGFIPLSIWYWATWIIDWPIRLFRFWRDGIYY